LALSTMDASQMEAYNPNYVGGDINAGVQDLRQFFTRPVVRVNPYTTPVRGLYLCSSSTPPGGGVHGMGGYFAAKATGWLYGWIGILGGIFLATYIAWQIDARNQRR
ncbi:MAG: hypothetical protein JJ992_17535, partial [Planctomycetes bacterium]|nr:hypothetical protein [Planctomycetota bacterium]